MKILVRFVFLFVFSIPVLAQDAGRGFTFHAGAGYSSVVGPISKRLDNGWNLQAGGGYMFTQHLGLIADYQYQGLGVPRDILNQLQVPDGSAWVHSVTVGPEIRFMPERRVSPYFIGGLGWYRRTIEFTRPTTAVATVFDPFFGFFLPAIIPTNQVLGTIQRDGFGENAGLGFNFKLRDKAKLFAEARYNHASHSREDTQLLPFTVGLRW